MNNSAARPVRQDKRVVPRFSEDIAGSWGLTEWRTSTNNDETTDVGGTASQEV